MDRTEIERGPQQSETVTDSDKPQSYLNIQSVSRSKHSSLIKTNNLMLYREINCCLFWELPKHISVHCVCVRAERRIWVLNLGVHKKTIEFQRVKGLERCDSVACQGGYKYVYTHIQEYLPFQLQTVDSGFDLVWLSKTNSKCCRIFSSLLFFFFSFHVFFIQFCSNACFLFHPLLQ
jgi:hypothetical protein